MILIFINIFNKIFNFRYLKPIFIYLFSIVQSNETEDSNENDMMIN